MTFSDLEALGAQEKARQAQFKERIFCCTSTACLSAGSRETHAALQTAVQAANSDQHAVEVVRTGCMGLCSRGPLVRVESENEETTLYSDVDTKLAQQIVHHHHPDIIVEEMGTETVDPHDIIHFRAAQKRAKERKKLDKFRLPAEMPFFAKQKKVVLAQVGQIDPDNFADYLAHGGYRALHKVLSDMSPENVCDAIQESGLRGRGGAGFPTGMKWHFVRREAAAQKYVVINGDEGDPGAYMDRTVMEDNPHQVLEGMLICAYAVGASYGYFYIRGEYPIAIKRIRHAIEDARAHGLLGESVLGTDFTFDADIRIGAGAFVCGEETALIHSIEGQRGIPRMRPPYPSTQGLRGAPTVLNNVETMANIAPIITHAADWYADIGSDKSKGTKVFALAGQLRNTGLIEVPMGISLREIVEEIGGGVPDGRAFKAAQTGGPSGGCIPASHLDTPVDYESLRDLGSIMGSGGLVVIDDSTRMPDFARFFIDFCVDESCGKCVPCRVGTVQIRSMLDKMIAGQAVPEDIEKLEQLCHLVKTTSLCGLGQSAPNPILSTLDFFREEYNALVLE
jgi:bidirectional [NiFe] hydrogenase diaphorase subunit